MIAGILILVIAGIICWYLFYQKTPWVGVGEETTKSEEKFGNKTVSLPDTFHNPFARVFRSNVIGPPEGQKQDTSPDAPKWSEYLVWRPSEFVDPDSQGNPMDIFANDHIAGPIHGEDDGEIATLAFGLDKTVSSIKIPEYADADNANDDHPPNVYSVRGSILTL